MKFLASFAALTLLAGALGAGDLVVTKEKHSDAMAGQAATDTVEVSWFGKDRMRTDEGTSITIVRADLKKMYMLDAKAKTYSVIDLPLDMKKYIPAEMAPMLEHMGAMKATVTPTTETKKIKDWDATRYTMTMSMPMGGMTQELWVVKNLGAEFPGWRELSATVMSANPFGGNMAEEMKKIDGLPVLVERTMKMPGGEMKARESVVSVETKEPAAGFYDLPEGYTEKPFDPLAGMGMGPGGGRPRRGQ
ncbi:MAG: DUF4412 domain-containing protein [Planctomycetota bacterium]